MGFFFILDASSAHANVLHLRFPFRCTCLRHVVCALADPVIAAQFCLADLARQDSWRIRIIRRSLSFDFSDVEFPRRRNSTLSNDSHSGEQARSSFRGAEQ